MLLWDVATGRLVASFPGVGARWGASPFSPDGRLVPIFDGDDTVRLYPTDPLAAARAHAIVANARFDVPVRLE